jgi:hypothetical protein
MIKDNESAPIGRDRVAAGRRGRVAVVGAFFLRKKGPLAVRKVLSIDNSYCLYREYPVGPAHEAPATAYNHYCSHASLKQWERRISEAEARDLVPNLEALDQDKDHEDRSRHELLVLQALRSASDEQLITELEARGPRRRVSPPVE